MNYHELTVFFDWVGPITIVAQSLFLILDEIRAALRSGRLGFESLRCLDRQIRVVRCEGRHGFRLKSKKRLCFPLEEVIR